MCRGFNRGNVIVLQVEPCLLKRLHQNHSSWIKFASYHTLLCKNTNRNEDHWQFFALHTLCRAFFAASPGVSVTRSDGLTTLNIIMGLKLPIVRLCVNNHTRCISTRDVIAALLLQWWKDWRMNNYKTNSNKEPQLHTKPWTFLCAYIDV